MVELLKAIDDVSKRKLNVSELLDIIVQEAFERKASDIHLEAREGNNLLVRYRIDGMLRDIVTIGNNLEESILFIIKVRAKLRTDIHFAPQDGKILFSFKVPQKPVPPVEEKEVEKKKDEKEEKKVEKKEEEIKKGDACPVPSVLDDGVCKIDARISILPVTFGEKVVIRLLSQNNRAFGLADLGFEPDDLAKVEASYREPYGLILATGPTGSGKTTTLYSILKILNTRNVNITTIEDPVEYNIEGVNHIQINTKSDLTFANGLRSILRQDPNIIMVGEIRDTETARITVNSALTGHLVLSTIHANDAISAIPRLIDMGIEPFLVASTVNIIISQRLARRLCDNCKSEYVLAKDEEHREMLKLRPDIAKHMNSTDKLFKANGCSKCDNTGYSGRIGIYEILRTNKEIRDVIISEPTTDNIYAIAKKQGFKLMMEDGILKLKKGVVSMEELMRVVAIKE
ncbi:type II secretion system protein GspE [Candidatus Dojkabacteria bacterium HGW-Dojkabacteria-1]|uniref:Type II secretion system protein GspE n=1 Tax=Candidatus Dojkabacteria bacterium HGW-Dojkabacteria-1 TaxID=2013761 RepID=A0A2N2F479_9BACT|nr:MAG: type II secretion system protein GspE [Candidatus Dojkabacteria bacterium HGW-Dojkabacteria-1]